MESFGTFEAKTRFSELVERAERGEEVVITRHGKPVAKLVPVRESEAERRERLRQLTNEMFEARKHLSIAPYTWKELRDEGRKR
jgi:prevent-host-death family protein